MAPPSLLAILVRPGAITREFARLLSRAERGADSLGALADDLRSELAVLSAQAADARSALEEGVVTPGQLFAPLLTLQRVGALLRSAKLDSLFLDEDRHRLLALLGADWTGFGADE